MDLHGETDPNGAIVAVVQARCGSTRLPGKVLLDLAGRPVLSWVVDRVAAARAVDCIVVATTDRPADDAIEALCSRQGIEVCRGSEDDVLDRYCRAVRQIECAGVSVGYVVRITADCPLIDPAVIDLLVHAALTGGYDYVSNIDPPTYPDGLDVEVIRRSALAEADRSARLPSEREHVTPFIRNAGHFRRFNVVHTPDLSGHRWTLDTEEDYLLLRTICDHLCRDGQPFGMDAVLALLDRHPEIAEINRKHRRNEGYQRSIEQDRQMSEEK